MSSLLPPRPPLASRRHSSDRTRAPLRSSPLAGPSLSRQGSVVRETPPEAHPRAKPSRITSNPDIPVLLPKSPLSAHTRIASDPRGSSSPRPDSPEQLTVRSKDGRRPKSTTPPMPNMPDWAHKSLSTPSSPLPPSSPSSSITPTSLGTSANGSDWLTHQPAPVFSRAGLGAGAVVMPVRASASRRNSISSQASSVRSVRSTASATRAIPEEFGALSSRNGDARSVRSTASKRSTTITFSPAPELPVIPATDKEPRRKRMSFSLSSLKMKTKSSSAGAYPIPQLSSPGRSSFEVIISRPSVSSDTALSPTHSPTAYTRGASPSPPTSYNSPDLNTNADAYTSSTRASSFVSSFATAATVDSIGVLASPPPLTQQNRSVASLEPSSSHTSPNVSTSISSTLTRVPSFGSTQATTMTMNNIGVLATPPFVKVGGRVFNASVDDLRSASVTHYGAEKAKRKSLWGRLKRVVSKKQAVPG